MERYEAVIDMLKAATEALGELGVSKQELLPPLLDFAAVAALVVAGEGGLQASIHRMENHLEAWRNRTILYEGDSSTLIQ